MTLRRSHGARKYTTDAETAVALIQIVFGVFKSLVTLERLTAIRNFAVCHSAVIIWKRQELVESGDAPRIGFGLREVFCPYSVYQVRHTAALTHTSRPYCDLKTSKIAFFFRKSFGFLSNFSRRRSGALQSCVKYVFSMSSIRLFYVHGVSTATLLRPQGDPHGDHRRPRCDCATFSASLRRLYGNYCVCPATVLRLYNDPITSLLRL